MQQPPEEKQPTRFEDRIPRPFSRFVSAWNAVPMGWVVAANVAATVLMSKFSNSLKWYVITRVAFETFLLYVAATATTWCCLSHACERLDYTPADRALVIGASTVAWLACRHLLRTKPPSG